MDENKEKEAILNELKSNKENFAAPLITLPEIKLNIVNVYSRLYNNKVLSTPLNNKLQNLNLNNKFFKAGGKLKRPLTHNKLKINSKMTKNQKYNFSLKNAIPANNGKEFTKNVTEQNINECLKKYSGGPQNINFLNIKYEENNDENNKYVDFYNLEDKNTGNSYLHLSTIENYPELVQYFLEKGANVDKQNNNGDTALHIALRNNNLEIVKIIMNYKPSLDISNNEGIIPFDLFDTKMKIDFNIDKLNIVNPRK